MTDLFNKDSHFYINSKKITVENFANALEEILTISERSFTKSRYKGLGEMNPEQLWDTTMNPDMRILGQVSIEDAQAADDLFHALMGDEVEPRRDFIDENANLSLIGRLGLRIKFFFSPGPNFSADSFESTKRLSYRELLSQNF